MEFRFYSLQHQQFIECLIKATTVYYGDNLCSLIVHGSYARGENKQKSDIDIFIILKQTKLSSKQRNFEFVQKIEAQCGDLAQACYQQGINTDVSTFILTKDEATHFNPLYLDMTSHAYVCVDHDGFFANILNTTRLKMRNWGSQKYQMGNLWYWQITPNIEPGTVIDYDK